MFGGFSSSNPIFIVSLGNVTAWGTELVIQIYRRSNRYPVTLLFLLILCSVFWLSLARLTSSLKGRGCCQLAARGPLQTAFSFIIASSACRQYCGTRWFGVLMAFDTVLSQQCRRIVKGGLRGHSLYPTLAHLGSTSTPFALTG